MKKHNVTKSRAKKHADLKKQITKQRPGIKEVMDVYNQWGVAHKAEQAHQEIKNSSYKIIYSHSSDPKSFF